jgi:hypothetical protein
MDTSVCQHGCRVLGVSDIDAWRDLASSVIGAEARRNEGADLLRSRLDEQHHRITLRPAKADSVTAIGWEVSILGSLESMRRRVAEQGRSITEATLEALADRKVEALCGFCDLDGLPLEICCGACTDDLPYGAIPRCVVGIRLRSARIAAIAALP